MGTSSDPVAGVGVRITLRDVSCAGTGFASHVGKKSISVRGER